MLHHHPPYAATSKRVQWCWCSIEYSRSTSLCLPFIGAGLISGEPMPCLRQYQAVYAQYGPKGSINDQMSRSALLSIGLGTLVACMNVGCGELHKFTGAHTFDVGSLIRYTLTGYRYRESGQCSCTLGHSWEAKVVLSFSSRWSPCRCRWKILPQSQPRSASLPQTFMKLCFGASHVRRAPVVAAHCKQRCWASKLQQKVHTPRLCTNMAVQRLCTVKALPGDMMHHCRSQIQRQARPPCRPAPP